jgi:hypothetical protein
LGERELRAGDGGTGLVRYDTGDVATFTLGQKGSCAKT